MDSYNIDGRTTLDNYCRYTCVYVCMYVIIHIKNWEIKIDEIKNSMWILLKIMGNLKTLFFLNCFPKVYEVHQTHTYKIYCTYNSLCEAADFLGLSKSCNR